MAGGELDITVGSVNYYNAKITASLLISCFVASSGGLLFGYDIGIAGGVTTMPPFLLKFFPSLLRKATSAKTDLYCMYDSQLLTTFTSSLFIAGLAASLIAARLTSSIGRRNIMLLGGCTYLAGGAINGAAANINMLILGRILLGLGVGFANQAAPVYLSEVAPAKWRGTLNTGFQLFVGIGVAVATCLNYVLARLSLSYGWRLSLGLAVVPGLLLSLGGLHLSDSPSSLVARGMIQEAKTALSKVRGVTEDNAVEELGDLVKASEVARAIKQEPFAVIFERQYRPHLTMAILLSSFQQLTGINVVGFYAPVLFRSIGFGGDSALIGAIILAMVNLGSTFVSTALVDRHGRRFLYKAGGTLMFICLIGVAILLAMTGGSNGTKQIKKSNAVIILVLMCIYEAGYGWSWGPLSRLIPSEIFPMKIRATGQSISVGVNFATSFVLSQTFLTMLCHFKYGLFLFYAGWIGVMSVFVLLFLPETKGIHIDEMNKVWKQHWYWRRFVQ